VNRFIGINPEKCIGCGTCLSACSDAHRERGLQAEPRLALTRTGEVSAAITCHHCEGAPCATVCPVNAITHEDGYIRVNEQTCIGCRLCAIACPFGAIHPSGTSIAGVAGTCDPTPLYPRALSPLLTQAPGQYTCAVKCDMCAFDPAGPRCVAACPTAALTLEDPAAESELDEAKRQRELASGTLLCAESVFFLEGREASRAAAATEGRPR